MIVMAYPWPVQEAERLAREKGWAIAADGNKWRRVVASPDPRDIIEARAIQLLLANDVLPICCGKRWGEGKGPCWAAPARGRGGCSAGARG